MRFFCPYQISDHYFMEENKSEANPRNRNVKYYTQL